MLSFTNYPVPLLNTHRGKPQASIFTPLIPNSKSFSHILCCKVLFDSIIVISILMEVKYLENGRGCLSLMNWQTVMRKLNFFEKHSCHSIIYAYSHTHTILSPVEFGPMQQTCLLVLQFELQLLVLINIWDQRQLTNVDHIILASTPPEEWLIGQDCHEWHHSSQTHPGQTLLWEPQKQTLFIYEKTTNDIQ